MITVNSQIQANSNTFAYVANINGNEISVLTRLPDGVTSKQVDDLAEEAKEKIKKQLFNELQEKT